MNIHALRSAVVGAVGAAGIAAACLAPAAAHADETSFLIEAKRLGLLAQDANMTSPGGPESSEYNAMRLGWYICAAYKGGYSDATIRERVNRVFPPDVSKQWIT
ncbi:hypothetical protein ACFXO7_14345, partial [Nocardia tengchongensis]